MLFLQGDDVGRNRSLSCHPLSGSAAPAAGNIIVATPDGMGKVQILPMAHMVTVFKDGRALPEFR
jgi:hypothetical protein